MKHTSMKHTNVKHTNVKHIMLLSLLVFAGLSFNTNTLKADDMDPISGVIIYATGSVAAVMIGATAEMSRERINHDRNTNDRNTSVRDARNTRLNPPRNIPASQSPADTDYTMTPRR